MGYLALLATLLFVFAPLSEAAAQGLQDFARFSKAIGKEVVIVDQHGLVREGVVESSTADDVRLRIGSATHTLARQEVASAHHVKDSSDDGAAKGFLIGLVMGVMASQGSTQESMMTDYLLGVALYTGLGYAFDAMNVNRQAFYRAPAPASSGPSPALKFSLRF